MVGTCKQCDSEFIQNPREVNRGNAKFCNLSCSTRWNNLNKIKTGRKKKSYSQRRDASKSKERFHFASRLGRIRKRHPIVNIDVDCLMILWENQGGKCFYTGEGMVFNSSNGCQPPNQCSIDRIDPNRGYESGNVVLCCFWVNSAKMRMTVEELKDRCMRLLGVTNEIHKQVSNTDPSII